MLHVRDSTDLPYRLQYSSGDLVRVPHVARIERLMHIELINSRKTTPRSTCPQAKTHTEWFQVTEAKAVKVFRKWHAWMAEEPCAGDEEGKWCLRPDMLDTLPELFRVEPEERQSAPSVRLKNRKPTSKRPGLARSKALRVSTSSSAKVIFKKMPAVTVE